MQKLFKPMIAAGLIFLASCSGSNVDIVPIPKDAGLVININAAALSDKISWSDFTRTSLYKDNAKKQLDSATLSLFENPASSGINIDKNITIFSSSVDKKEQYAVGGFLSDEEKFAALISKDLGAPSTGADFKYVTKNEFSVAWNKERFIMGAVVTTPNYLGAYDDEDYDAPSNVDFEAHWNKYFSLKGSDLLNGDKYLKEAIGLGGDVQMYTNSNQQLRTYQQFLGMTKLADLLKDNYSLTSVSFDNGIITVKSTGHYNSILAKIIDKHIKNDVDLSRLKSLPGEQVVAGGAFEFDPGIIVELLKEAGMEGIANQYLASEGLTLEDLQKAFGKNLFFGLSGVTIGPKEKTDWSDWENPKTYTVNTVTDIIGAAGINVGEKAYFQKLMNLVEKTAGEEVDKNVTYNDKWLIVARTKEDADLVMSGNGKTDNDYLNKLKGTAGGFFFDANQLFALLQQDDELKESAPILISHLEGGYFIYSVKGKKVEQYAELTLDDKNTNSLKSLLNMTDALYLANEKKNN